MIGQPVTGGDGQTPRILACLSPLINQGRRGDPDGEPGGGGASLLSPSRTGGDNRQADGGEHRGPLHARAGATPFFMVCEVGRSQGRRALSPPWAGPGRNKRDSACAGLRGSAAQPANGQRPQAGLNDPAGAPAPARARADTRPGRWPPRWPGSCGACRWHGETISCRVLEVLGL